MIRKHWPLLLIALGFAATVGAVAIRAARLDRYLEQHGCTPLPMTGPEQSAGQAAGTVCWKCAGGQEICR